MATEKMAEQAAQLSEHLASFCHKHRVPYPVMVLAARIMVRRGEAILAAKHQPGTVADYQQALAIMLWRQDEGLRRGGVPFESFESSNPLALKQVADQTDDQTVEVLSKQAEDLAERIMNLMMAAGYARTVAALACAACTHLFEGVIRQEDPEQYKRYQMTLARVVREADDGLTAEGVPPVRAD